MPQKAAPDRSGRIGCRRPVGSASPLALSSEADAVVPENRFNCSRQSVSTDLFHAERGGGCGPCSATPEPVLLPSPGYF